MPIIILKPKEASKKLKKVVKKLNADERKALQQTSQKQEKQNQR